MLLQSLYGILRACGREATCGRQHGRDKTLVKANGKYENTGQHKEEGVSVTVSAVAETFV